MPVYSYDPPDRFVAGTVGQPGERTFYLQASANGRVTSVALEKFQVSLLAERLEELLDEVLRRSGGKSSVPAASARRAGRRRAARPAADGGLPGRRHRAGLGRRGRTGRDRGAGGVGDARRVAGRRVPGERPGRAPGADHRCGRPRVLPAGAADRGQGRPPCPLCGLPLDAEGHICPRQNGHRVSNALSRRSAARGPPRRGPSRRAERRWPADVSAGAARRMTTRPRWPAGPGQPGGGRAAGRRVQRDALLHGPRRRHRGGLRLQAGGRGAAAVGLPARHAGRPGGGRVRGVPGRGLEPGAAHGVPRRPVRARHVPAVDRRRRHRRPGRAVPQRGPPGAAATWPSSTRW